MPEQRPFYVIAHRVLTVQGVRDALSNGANAIEIDMYAWKSGWWADHDGLAASAGDTAKAMFTEIAAQRKSGKPVTFVWLDIKNQEYVTDPWDATWKFASMIGLRDLAREILQPEGIRVLFGCYSGEGANYRAIVEGLNEYEAVNLDGNAADVYASFKKCGPTKNKRIYSKGLFNTQWNLGNILVQLREGRKTSEFGKVFGWTVQAYQGQRTRSMLETGVDGVIYGFEKTYYYDHDWTRDAAKEIIEWVSENADRLRVAGINDNPW